MSGPAPILDPWMDAHEAAAYLDRFFPSVSAHFRDVAKKDCARHLRAFRGAALVYGHADAMERRPPRRDDMTRRIEWMPRYRVCAPSLLALEAALAGTGLTVRAHRGQLWIGGMTDLGPVL